MPPDTPPRGVHRPVHHGVHHLAKSAEMMDTLFISNADKLNAPVHQHPVHHIAEPHDGQHDGQPKCLISRQTKPLSIFFSFKREKREIEREKSAPEGIRARVIDGGQVVSR